MMIEPTESESKETLDRIHRSHGDDPAGGPARIPSCCTRRRTSRRCAAWTRRWPRASRSSNGREGRSIEPTARSFSSCRNSGPKRAATSPPATTMEVGAGTMTPDTFFRVLGTKPWKVAYWQPSRRPDDGRYGQNPNRVQKHNQFQVILKPVPIEGQHALPGQPDLPGRGHPASMTSNSTRTTGRPPRWVPGASAGR